MWKDQCEKVLRENLEGQDTLAAGQGPLQSLCTPMSRSVPSPVLCLVPALPYCPGCLASLQTCPVAAGLCGQLWKPILSHPQDTGLVI